MKRVTYLLKDEHGTVQSRWVLPEEETVALEPWQIRCVQTRGWRLEAWETKESGVQIHGWADWESVADNLAAVVKVLMNYDELSEEQGEQFLIDAQAALDNYHVAQMEVSVADVDAIPEIEGDTDG